MAITDLIPWSRTRNMPVPRQTEEHPFLALHREMNRMFDNFFRGFDLPTSHTPGWLVGGWPHVEIRETDNAVKLVAELPGMEQKDIELTLNEGMLTLKGEKKPRPTVRSVASAGTASSSGLCSLARMSIPRRSRPSSRTAC